MWWSGGIEIQRWAVRGGVIMLGGSGSEEGKVLRRIKRCGEAVQEGMSGEVVVGINGGGG